MHETTVRESSTAVRRLLVPFLVLAGLGALQLYVFPADTDRFFAWTLTPQPSATFMGAGFAAGVVLTALSYRSHLWSVARAATLTIFVFSVAMTAATFLHLDKLHLVTGAVTGRLAAWLWLGVYVVVTPALGVVIWTQVRRPGVDPPRRRTLPSGLRTVLLVMGVGLVGFGVWLFVWPVDAAAAWPWTLTAFAGRAIAAWLLAIGWAALETVVENDADRVRPAAVTFAVLGVLLLGGIARSAGEFDWDRMASWVYLAGVVVATLVGGYGASFTWSRPGAVASRGLVKETS